MTVTGGGGGDCLDPRGPGGPKPYKPWEAAARPRSEVGGLGSYSSDWLACLSHAPAPGPVLGLLRCDCRASSGASLADASARSLLLFAAPAARSSLGV